MKDKKISALGRPVILTEKTNAAIAAISFTVLVLAFAIPLFSGEEPLKAAGLSLGAAFSVFMAWALSRELDPDFPWAAFFPSALMMMLLLVWPQAFHPRFIALFWLLQTLRAINRTAGPKPTVFDSFFLLAATVWVSFDGVWTAGFLAAAAFLLDGMLIDSTDRHKWFAIPAAATSVIALWAAPDAFPSVNAGEALYLLIPLALFLAVILNTKQLHSVGDRTGVKLNLRRLKAAQVFSIAVVAVFYFQNGIDAIYGFLPVIVVFAGLFPGRILEGFIKR